MCVLHRAAQLFLTPDNSLPSPGLSRAVSAKPFRNDGQNYQKGDSREVFFFLSERWLCFFFTTNIGFFPTAVVVCSRLPCNRVVSPSSGGVSGCVAGLVFVEKLLFILASGLIGTAGPRPLDDRSSVGLTRCPLVEVIFSFRLAISELLLRATG